MTIFRFHWALFPSIVGMWVSQSCAQGSCKSGLQSGSKQLERAWVARNTCVLTGAADLELLATIEKFPLSMQTVPDDTAQRQELAEELADMQWWISRSTGSVQLHPLVPLSVLYAKGGHDSGKVGRTWSDHHAEFSDFISACGVRRVLEVGAGGHGMLAQRFVEMHLDAQYHIVDPDVPLWSHERVTMHPTFFGAGFALLSPVDAVVHSHTLEHIHEPRTFLTQISRFLGTSGWHIFSIPRMELWLDRNYSNALNWEHTLYLTEANVEYLLHSTGFQIVSKQYFLEDHSVFYAARKRRADEIVQEPSPPYDYARNRAAFVSWLDSTRDFVTRVNHKIQTGVSGRVYVFGAHVFTQFLVALGLNTSAVIGVLDNNPGKASRRLYGTALKVLTPQTALAGQRGVVIILRAGAYQEDIRNGILDLDPQAVFWD